MSSAWKRKRFWTSTGVDEAEGGFTVTLDGRSIRTPAKAPLVLPTRALAEAVAEEWEAQQGEIDPASMPLTRTANSAIDTVARNHAAVAADLAAYGDSDLLCYRAEAPAALAARQSDGWDPWLAWSAGIGAPLRVGTGVIAVDQPPESLARLASRVRALSPLELAAFHDLVTLTGSLVLGLALAEGLIEPDAAFDLSRIDEDWQAELWGEDEEAAESAALKRQALRDAARFLRLAR